MFKKYLVGALLAFGLIGIVPKTQAIENLGAFIITNFEVDILVKKEAVLEVEEIIDVNFSEKRHGIFRNIPVKYKGQNTNKTYRVDFVCGDDKTEKKVVELKAIKELSNWERAITLNYLKLSSYKIALLINFGGVSLEYERFVDFHGNK